MFRANDKLISRKVGDELLIYDPHTSESHLLKGAARRVFGDCQNQETEFNSAELAIIRVLVDKGLIEDLDPDQSSRREFITGASRAAALAAVLSVAAPCPAAAGSCVASCVAGDCCECGPCDGTSFCMQAICTNSTVSFRTAIPVFTCAVDGSPGAAQACRAAAGTAIPDAGGLCASAGVSGGTHIFFCCTS